MAIKILRGGTASIALTGTGLYTSNEIWEIHNQLQQVVGSASKPHGWECVAEGAGGVLLTAPSFAMVMPHTLYWRLHTESPFRTASFTVV
jgi:hypothetical protein